MSALAIAAIMVLTPAANAASAAIAIHGGTPTNDYSVYSNGCSKAVLQKPGFSVATGLGHAAMKDTSKTCKPAQGGKSVYSYGETYAGVGKTVALKLTAAYSSANISWNIKGIAADAASGSISHCPVNYYSYNYTYTYGNITGTETFKETSSYCAATASWNIYSDPEVYDVTTKTYSSSYWSLYNETGVYYDMFAYSENYSNGGYSNYSYNYTSLHHYGPTNSTSINQAFTSILSGSWSKGDQLIIYASVYVSAYTEVEYASSGHAAALVNLAGTTGHVDLVGITLT